MARLSRKYNREEYWIEHQLHKSKQEAIENKDWKSYQQSIQMYLTSCYETFLAEHPKAKPQDVFENIEFFAEAEKIKNECRDVFGFEPMIRITYGDRKFGDGIIVSEHVARGKSKVDRVMVQHG